MTYGTAISNLIVIESLQKEKEMGWKNVEEITLKIIYI